MVEVLLTEDEKESIDAILEVLARRIHWVKEFIRLDTLPSETSFQFQEHLEPSEHRSMSQLEEELTTEAIVQEETSALPTNVSEIESTVLHFWAKNWLHCWANKWLHFSASIWLHLFQKFRDFLSEVRVFWHWVDDLTGAAELYEAILKPFEASKIKPILGFTFCTRSCSPFGQGAHFGVSFELWGPCSLSIGIDP